MDKNLHEGHRERVRQEFLQHGFDHNTPPHKILEILLFYCVQRADTNPIAHELINKYGSVAGVLDAPVEELAAVRGLSERGAVLLKLIMPTAQRYIYDKQEQKPTFTGLDSIGKYALGRFLGETRERVAIMCLDTRGSMLGFEFLSDGDLSSVGLSQRDIAKTALGFNATAVVLCHNHPNGIALPSDNDLLFTKDTADTLAKIGVQLIDHVVLSDTDFVSMAQSEQYGYIFAPK
ncbi:MAG: RadC family protein [Clostridia bacterium]|nr:RadC family protein [Clostridia bacterium]